MKRFLSLCALGIGFVTTGSVASAYNSVMDFGLVMQGAAKTQYLQMSNPTNSPMTIQLLAVNAPDFHVFSNCMNVLPPGRFCNFQITMFCNRAGFVHGLMLFSINGQTSQLTMRGICQALPTPNPPIPRPPQP